MLHIYYVLFLNTINISDSDQNTLKHIVCIKSDYYLLNSEVGINVYYNDDAKELMNFKPMIMSNFLE